VLETNFLHKRCRQRPYLCNDNQTSWENFGETSNGAISKDWGEVLRFKPLFWQSVPTNSTEVLENMFFGVLHHPTKFEAKILTRKFYLWRKEKNPL